jgi:hypothetical protein
MGSIIKTALAGAICALLVFYAMGTAYLDEVYGKRIAALEKDAALYSARNRELAQHNLELEATREGMLTQLMVEKEKVSLMRETVSRHATGAKVSAGTDDGAAEPVVSATIATTSQTTLAEELARLDAARKTAQAAPTQQKVTRAS